ncbi:MBL fold metallo-hydrolase [Clostridiaceae bacterium M8S5]|nr:MBL fold metallo-hydrolase [Clostridiaceae bacterium M8S5]
MSIRFCSLASGSSGNCQYIETEKIRILVDAGLSGKRIQQALESIQVDPKTINGILVTHEHSDHVKGVGILSRRFNLPIYVNTNTWESMRNSMGKVKEENIKTFTTGDHFEIADLGIESFKIHHDASDPVGYCINHKSTKISLLTDTGHVDEEIKKKIKKSNLLLLESNHNPEMVRVGRYPWPLKKRILGDFGHISNEVAGETITDVYTYDMKVILLAHLSQENNFPELAYKTVSDIMTQSGIDIKKDVKLDMTYRSKPSKVYTL